MKIVEDRNRAIYHRYLVTGNKMLVGREFNVSARTVGRIVAKMEDQTPIKSEGPCGNDSPAISNTNAIISRESIVIFINGEMLTITKDHSDFDLYFNTLISNGLSESSISYVYDEFYALRNKVKTFYELNVAECHKLELDLTNYTARIINLRDTASEPIEVSGKLLDVLVQRIVEEKNEVDAKALVNFIVRLEENPSNRVVNRLYDFIMATNIEIMEDGRLLCYKRVTEDFRDFHTGTFDNSVGRTVSLPRNKVDEDPSEHCSHGLHVCSQDYLSHYYSNRGVVIRVLVCPSDFVCFPDDYENASKARVCKYYVHSVHSFNSN